MFIKSGSLATVLLVGSTLILGGCGAEAPEDESVSDEAVELGSTEQAVYIGWTAYTSEERPPIVCDGGSPSRLQANPVQCLQAFAGGWRAGDSVRAHGRHPEGNA